MSRGGRAGRVVLTATAALAAFQTPAWAEITAGPDIIAAPASVAKCSAGGATNAHQQGFNERQNVKLTADLEVDGGGIIPAGVIVNSHMIFLNSNPCGTSITNVGQVWTFDGPILGVMSDEDGLLEEASNFLGATGTAYPAAFTYRGLEPSLGDGYTIAGNQLTVDLHVTEPGDWIRVITAAKGYTGVTFSLNYGSFASILPGQAAHIYTVGNPLVGWPNPASSTPGVPQMLLAGPRLGIALSGGCVQMRELDALSFGHDKGSGFYFSVDEFSQGAFGTAVYSEGKNGLFHEAAADIFKYTPGVAGNQDYIDGDGNVQDVVSGGVHHYSFDGPGLGLVEPLFNDIAWNDQGDNVDALDMDTRPSDLLGPVYFSLGGSLSITDPREPAPACAMDSATANGVSGADILKCAAPGAGAVFTVYAHAADLGLNANLDDLDALALLENGDGVFNPVQDRVYFSVRYGSHLTTVMDPVTGRNFHQADILTVDTLGGLPRIVVPYASLGLNAEDELDALDTYQLVVLGDLNCDEQLDFFDIDWFILALLDPAGYAAAQPDCDRDRADVNADGAIDFFDIDRFIELLLG